jgi:HlyD family secretion protein
VRVNKTYWKTLRTIVIIIDNMRKAERREVEDTTVERKAVIGLPEMETGRPAGRRSQVLRRSSIAALMLAVVLGAAGCGKKGGDAEAGTKPLAVKVDAVTATVVATAPATTGSINKTVDVTGSLVALQDVVVGAKSAGRVTTVYPHEGDMVSAGQTVAVMDMADLQAQVQSAQANVLAFQTKEQQAQVALQQARNALSNAQTNVNWTDQTTKSAVDTAKSALLAAQENLSLVKAGAREQERQQAQEAVTSAKANYEKAKADLARFQELADKEAISKLQLDQYKAAFDSAQAQYNSAKQALSLINEGARPQDLRRAEIGVQQAKDALARAQSDRQQVNLRREDVKIAQSGINAAQAGIASARASTAQARAQLRIAQDAVSNAYVKSPISGYVAERKAEPGQQLGAGGAVLRIVDPNTVYFQAVLSESQFSQIRLGMAADVSVDALPGTKYRGRLSRVLPVASSARSFLVRIDITPDKRMRPQMFARGSILIDTHANTTLVPKDAVLFDATSNRNRVFIAASDGKAQERQVRVGYTNPQFVEVLRNDVKPGEKVIVEGQTSLQNGDAIRVQ